MKPVCVFLAILSADRVIIDITNERTDQWRQATMTGKELIESKRDEIRAIAEQHGARDISVFGSVARGEARSDSDVDFLVSFEKGRSLLDQAALLVQLQDLLNIRVDVVSEGGINPRMRDRILKKAVPL